MHYNITNVRNCYIQVFGHVLITHLMASKKTNKKVESMKRTDGKFKSRQFAFQPFRNDSLGSMQSLAQPYNRTEYKKLQILSAVVQQSEIKSKIFKGCVFRINGYLGLAGLTDLEFRDLIAQNSGRVSKSLTGVTHVICTRLPNEMKTDVRTKRIALTPKWVLECIAKQCMVDVHPYLVANGP